MTDEERPAPLPKGWTGGEQPAYMKPPQTPFEKGNGWVSPAEKALVGCMILLILVLVLIVGLGSIRANQLQEDTLRNRDENLKNRAVDCHMLSAMGQEVDPNGPCFEPKTLDYWDPDDVTPPSTASTRMICAISVIQQVSPEDLSPACAEFGLGLGGGQSGDG